MSNFFDQPFTADATQANTGGDYTPIPEGVYPLLVEKSFIKKTQAGNDMMSVQYAVCEGEYEGRKLFGNFNIDHPKAEVVLIATKELHALLILANIKEINQPEDLIGAVFTAKVTVEKRKDTGALQNKVLLSLIKDDHAPIVVLDAPEAPVAAKPRAAPRPAPSAKANW